MQNVKRIHHMCRHFLYDYSFETRLTDSIVHSTAENTNPITAKFFAYERVVVFISLKISRAVCCLSTSVTLGFTLEVNKPNAAPRPYPRINC